jgi:predicted ArsR family transcriptional regulator
MSSGRREDVLRALRAAGGPLSITELAQRLDVHPNTVRFHLDALISAGRVQRDEAEHARPGRPPQLFRAVAGMDPGGPRRYRLLADILVGALAAQPGAAAAATAAGRSWGDHAARTKGAPRKGRVIKGLTELLAEIGFSPEPRRTAGAAIREIGLRNCPFLELAHAHAEVVCPLHLGLMQGALSAWGAPVTVESLTPFAEPDRCVARLAPVQATR